MRKSGLAAMVALAAFSGSAMAEVEPTSVKASLKITESGICDMDDCEGEFKVSATGAQTFPLSSSVSDQFTPATKITIDLIEVGNFTFTFNQDPNYQTGDESINITVTETGGGETAQTNLKMSWKNGVAKVAVKFQVQGDGGLISSRAANAVNAALPPGNPRNTDSMTVRLENGMTVLEESTGYFAISYSQSTKVKALPDNAFSQKTTISAKSKYQVGEPEMLPF